MGRMGNAVVLGGKGMLGQDLVGLLRHDDLFGEVVTGDYPEVDITNDSTLRSFLGAARPVVIFNCAAMTDVDGCERNRDACFRVNAEGAGRVAALAAEMGARLIHLSTNYVFDGMKGSPYVEEDVPMPLSVYGRSKLDGERLVAQAGGRWIIARTAWLYGQGRDNFVQRMLEYARETGVVAAVTDQVGSPTWTRDLAAALIALAKSEATGIFHVVNEGACSRFEWVQAMLAVAGVRAALRPALSTEFPRPVMVPPYSALSTQKLRRVLGHRMRPWREALDEYLRG